MCIIPDRNFMKPKMKHETKEYHKDVLKKANDFLESYEDPFKSVTHNKNSDGKYERNSNIIKVIVRAILLCVEQGIALRGHREEDSSSYIERNFLAIIHIFG